MNKNQKIEYKDYRAEPSETTFKIYATNVKTNREEFIRCIRGKAQAYGYVSRMNRVRKHKFSSNCLLQIMHEKNITAEELSQKVNISKITIRSYMKNNIQPSYGTLVYIADTLGVKPHELINF